MFAKRNSYFGCGGEDLTEPARALIVRGQLLLANAKRYRESPPPVRFGDLCGPTTGR